MICKTFLEILKESAKKLLKWIFDEICKRRES
jgi:hypothetical protein